MRAIAERDIILLALDVFIETLERDRQENTYSAITEARLKAASMARDSVAQEKD